MGDHCSRSGLYIRIRQFPFDSSLYEFDSDFHGTFSWGSKVRLINAMLVVYTKIINDTVNSIVIIRYQVNYRFL